MKNLLFLLLPILLFAQSYVVSNIPLPKSYIQDLDPYDCDETCMQEYLDHDMLFSFLSHADRKLQNKQQNDIRVMNIAILNLGSHVNGSKVKIAILLPYKKIGKYATSVTNAAFAYLITKNYAFELKSYKIESEEPADIQNAMQKMKADGFDYVIATVTKKGAENIINLDEDINVYFPTINKNDLNVTSPYATFGAIDYAQQSKIITQEAISPLVIFSDKSSTGKKLSSLEEHEFKYSEEELIPEHKVIKYSLPRRVTNLENYLKENEKIVEGSFILNTPIVKTGMIMSQLTLYDVNATNVLSTQVNYSPLLLSMTQYDDRKNMIVANSIIVQNDVLTETNSLLNNDIVYDWINYTTTIGVDYFFSVITNDQRKYNIPLKEQQMQYGVELMRPLLSKFVKYSTPEERED